MPSTSIRAVNVIHGRIKFSVYGWVVYIVYVYPIFFMHSSINEQNLHRPVTSKEIETVIKNLPTNKLYTLVPF